MAGQHFVQNDAQGVQVAARVTPLPFDLFRGNVFRRSPRLGELAERQPPRAGVGSDTEIDQLDAVVGVDHDVFRLQIAVHDPVPVDVVERVADLLAAHAHRPLRGKLSVLVNDLAQQSSFHPFQHHVKVDAVRLGRRP